MRNHTLSLNLHNLPVLCLCLLLAVVCASCQSSASGTQYLIGVSQCSDDAWRTKLNEEMQRELLFHPEIRLEVRSAGDDNDRQAQDIDYFINKRVDLLIVSPNEAAVLTPAVSRAYDAGIPVIVADRKVTGDKYTAFIGGDNLAVGHLLGQYVMMKLPEGGRILEILGLPGSTPAVLRHDGLMETLSGNEERYHIAQGVGNWFKDQAKEEVARLLAEYPDTRMVIAQNDLMAIGARMAADSLMPDHDIIFIGVDGLTGSGNGVEAITQGQVMASAVYATGGDLIIQTAVKILRGEPFERNISLETYLIDAESAPLINNIYQEVDHEVGTVMMLKEKVDYYWQQHNLEQALLYTLLAFLLLVIVFIIILYRLYYAKKLINESLGRQQKTLKEQRDKLKEQRDQLETQNEQLTRLSDQVKEATQAKIMFFTNISHDFRTPLTLINGPIEQLMIKADNDGLQADHPVHQLLHLAHKNVQVLFRLVTQVLDFRKYESGKLELNLQPMDMKEAVEGWFDSFSGLALRQHIHLDLQCGEGDYKTMGDVSKLERVFFNLMGNAFKFTPENGRIQVALNRTDHNIILRVGDSGPGIHIEHIQRIFENFYQIDSAHHEGSGLGLALVKSFVETHQGTIEVENQQEGTGTVFTVTLPLRVYNPQMAENEVPSTTSISAEQIESELAEIPESIECEEDETKPVVLVIDDNVDILQYLTVLLSPTYRVFTATGGEEGIRKAMRLVPNVILCDVMMPGIDGMEACRRLKSEVNTCHIPVLMLTACTLDEQRVQGHKEGADAYITKPFSSEVLLAQLEVLVRNHNKVRAYFADGLMSSVNNGEVGVSSAGNGTSPERQPSLDDKFLQKLRSLIEQNLADSDFGVEQLGDEIGMSRAQLYRKCKALTNYSPVELIRNTRLKKAQKLLAQGDETIAQVAYSVGFTAPSYFTKCYKEYFGENPVELVKRKG